MNRLQRKCFFVSALVHGALLALLFFGAAFSTSKPEINDLPVLELIPARIIDEAFSGGGAPAAPAIAQAPAPAMEQPVPPPKPEPKAPDPIIPKPVAPEPERTVTTPPKITPKPTREPEEPPARITETTKPSQKKPEPTDEFSPVDRTAVNRAQAKEREKAIQRARTQAQEAWRKNLSRSVSNLRGNFSGSTTVETGPGGEAYANYAQVVKSIYTHAWETPDDVNDDTLNVGVQVTIAKDGNVIASKVIAPSGNASLDRSVSAALEKVRFVAAFPAGAKDDKRTFKLKFNLKAKRDTG
jgi:TonB family protein